MSIPALLNPVLVEIASFMLHLSAHAQWPGGVCYIRIDYRMFICLLFLSTLETLSRWKRISRMFYKITFLGRFSAHAKAHLKFSWCILNKQVTSKWKPSTLSISLFCLSSWSQPGWQSRAVTSSPGFCQLGERYTFFSQIVGELGVVSAWEKHSWKREQGLQHVGIQKHFGVVYNTLSILTGRCPTDSDTVQFNLTKYTVVW